jgi:hypothetical protein
VLGAARPAVVAQLALQAEADWRATVPGVLSQLQLPALKNAVPAMGEADTSGFAAELVALLGHAHEGVSRTAAASLIAMTQQLNTSDESESAKLLASLAVPLTTACVAVDGMVMMAVLAVIQEGFGETQWSFAGGGLWIQGTEGAATSDTAEPAAPADHTAALQVAMVNLAQACIACLVCGDGKPAAPRRNEAEGAEDEGEDDEEGEEGDDVVRGMQKEAAIRSAATHAIGALGKQFLSGPTVADDCPFCKALHAVLECDGAQHRAAGLVRPAL